MMTWVSQSITCMVDCWNLGERLWHFCGSMSSSIESYETTHWILILAFGGPLCHKDRESSPASQHAFQFSKNFHLGI